MSAVAPPMSMIVNAAPMPQASPPTSRADNGFARCLDQARESEPTEPDGAAQRPNAGKPPSNPKADRSARTPGAARTASKDQTPPKEAAEAKDANTADTAHDEAAAPDLAALLPGWAPPPAAAPAATAAADGSGLLQAGTAATSAKSSPALPRDDLGVRALAPLALAGPANEANDTSAVPPGAALQAVASEPRSASPDLQTSPLPTTLPGALVAAATTPLASKAAEAPLPTATVPSPIDSPAFAPALATQVRWWATDGVQQAQLLLNPAEMGPVTVNIVLDGRDARIDFSADLAATRGAIEAALPVLAAALDDSGLKLSGGGVHDGSAQHQREWNGLRVMHRTSAAASTRGADAHDGVTARHSTPGRGIVDLVA
jgi:flagellar hook-length control protein FliK